MGRLYSSWNLVTRPVAPARTRAACGDTITDGPFVDSKEVIAGFYVIEAPDLDAALAIARLNPVVREGGGVEVRPVHSSFIKREEQTTT